MLLKIFYVFVIVSFSYVCGVPRDSTSYISVKNHVGHGEVYEEYDDGHVGYDDEVGDADDDFVENVHYDKYPHHHPNYVYKYGVDDYDSKDFKTQHEYREGDVVKGSYSVVQPDGKTRIVRYTADKKNGFKAEVVYENTQF